MLSLTRWLILPFSLVLAAIPLPAQAYLQFSQLGAVRAYVEVRDSADFSVNTTGGLTIAAWLRPDTLTFRYTDGSGYVHWLGKGDPGQHEWVFRIYSRENTEGRQNRVSFYVLNPRGGLGIGSYFQDPIKPGEWIHVVGVADRERTYIYKNGVLRKCDQYRGSGDGTCHRYSQEIWITPQRGHAPLRIAHGDGRSYFEGAIGRVRIWNRAMGSTEVAALYKQGAVPPGLVAEYLLNEHDGAIAHDTAGAHPGTIMQATWGSDPEPGP